MLIEENTDLRITCIVDRISSACRNLFALSGIFIEKNRLQPKMLTFYIRFPILSRIIEGGGYDIIQRRILEISFTSSQKRKVLA